MIDERDVERPRDCRPGGMVVNVGSHRLVVPTDAED